MSTNNGNNTQNDANKQLNNNGPVYQNTYQHQHNSSPYSIYYSNPQQSHYDNTTNYYNTIPQPNQQSFVNLNQQPNYAQNLQISTQQQPILSQQIPQQQVNPNSQYNQFFNQQQYQPIAQNIPTIGLNQEQGQPIGQILPVQNNNQLQPSNYINNQSPNQIPQSTLYYSTGKSYTNDPEIKQLFEDYWKYEKNPPEPFKSSIRRISLMGNIYSFGLLIYMLTRISNPGNSKWKLFGVYIGVSLLISTTKLGLLLAEYKKAFDYVYTGKDKSYIRKEIDILAQNKLKII
jgi:hypothetical protein